MKTSNNTITKLNEDGGLLWRIDKKHRQYEYHIRRDSNQYKLFRRILFKGFDKYPSGVYRNGFGIHRNGSYLVNRIKERLGEDVRLTIQTKGRSEIYKSKRNYHIVLKNDDFRELLAEYARLNALKNQQYRKFLLARLFKLFPNSKLVRKNELEQTGDYQPDTLHNLFSSDGFSLNRLTRNDLQALADILPKFIDKHAATFLDPKDEKKVLAIRNKSQRVYLDRIIADFETRLRRKKHNEYDWQRFLREYILLANSSYTDVVEKASITLQGKYPDFMLIDSYDYIDIFEIKKPDTNLLLEDKSRHNYYWSEEVSKAISQVENYINELSINSLEFQRELRRIKKIDVRVIKPRGFVVAGVSSQLGSEKKEDDFRILNSSLKNLEVLLYDDLLIRLKHFAKSLRKN